MGEAVDERRGATAVAPLARGRCGEAVGLLAAAFRDNPLNQAVIRGSAARRLRCNRLGMRATLSACFGHALILGANEPQPSAGERVDDFPSGRHLAGVLLSAPPHRYPFPRPRFSDQLRSLLGQGFAVQRRWSKAFHRLLTLHPVEPHWYLSALGVRPGLQGRGIGRALLDAWLSEIDAQPRPAYLETDQQKNVAFYAPAGFEVIRELSVLGTPIWCLQRPACTRG